MDARLLGVPAPRAQHALHAVRGVHQAPIQRQLGSHAPLERRRQRCTPSSLYRRGTIRRCFYLGEPKLHGVAGVEGVAALGTRTSCVPATPATPTRLGWECICPHFWPQGVGPRTAASNMGCRRIGRAAGSRPPPSSLDSLIYETPPFKPLWRCAVGAVRRAVRYHSGRSGWKWKRAHNRKLSAMGRPKDNPGA